MPRFLRLFMVLPQLGMLLSTACGGDGERKEQPEYNLAFLNVVVGTPGVDVFLNATKLASDVAFGALANMRVPVGSDRLEAFTHSDSPTPPSEAPLFVLNLIAAEKDGSVLAVADGDVDPQTPEYVAPEAQLYANGFAVYPPNLAIRFVHAAPDLPGLRTIGIRDNDASATMGTLLVDSLNFRRDSGAQGIPVAPLGLPGAFLGIGRQGGVLTSGGPVGVTVDSYDPRQALYRFSPSGELVSGERMYLVIAGSKDQGAAPDRRLQLLRIAANTDGSFAAPVPVALLP